MSSNRVLKNNISNNYLFGRILSVTSGQLTQHSFIRYGQIKSDSFFNLRSDSTGDCELIINGEELFNELIDVLSNNMAVLEIFIYDDYENLESNEYNEFYFYKGFSVENDPQKFETTFKIQLTSFASTFFSKTYVEHTKEYDFASIPVDVESGEKIMPDDYNKIVFNNETIENILIRILNDNLFACVNRCKGDIHVSEPTRNIKHIILGGVQTTLLGNLTTCVEKQSLLNLLEHYASSFKGRGINDRYIFKLKYDPILFVLKVYVIINPTINIVNGKVRDNYTFYKREVNVSTDSVNILVESGSNDNNALNNSYNPKPYAFKENESLVVGNLEEGETSLAFEDEALSEAGSKEITDNIELDIYFNNLDYFKDINNGQVVNLTGYNNVNGDYIIKQISCIITQTYLDFAIDDMEKI